MKRTRDALAQDQATNGLNMNSGFMSDENPQKKMKLNHNQPFVANVQQTNSSQEFGIPAFQPQAMPNTPLNPNLQQQPPQQHNNAQTNFHYIPSEFESMDDHDGSEQAFEKNPNPGKQQPVAAAAGFEMSTSPQPFFPLSTSPNQNSNQEPTLKEHQTLSPKPTSNFITPLKTTNINFVATTPATISPPSVQQTELQNNNNAAPGTPDWIKAKIAEERKRIESTFKETESSNQELFAYFNELQALAHKHKLKFEYPEIVVIGMQSDGKSSFIECLLGFQFNTVDTQIGTRRPLIIQMVTDFSQEQPKCVFLKEDLSVFEANPTPPHEIEKEIRKRTDSICGKESVSSRPIVLRVQYKYCANLTIYDTPGFRKAENDPLGPKILKMVKKLIAPRHRIILCLEQATVEFCNTQVRPTVEEMDPGFQRTIFVLTKFNNRCNQFKNSKETNGFFKSGLTISKNMFFISMPSGPDARDLDAQKFKTKTLDTHLKDYKKCVKLNFDEKTFSSHFGFFSLKQHLEKLLNAKYKERLIPLMQMIDNYCDAKEQTAAEIAKNIEKLELECKDIDAIVTRFIHEYTKNIFEMLEGTTKFLPSKNGFTIKEEREACGVPNWPRFNFSDEEIPIRNGDYKLYGGAQLERLLTEYQIVSHSQEFPETSDDDVASLCGLHSNHSVPDYDRASAELVKTKVNEVFEPLIQIFLKRTRYIMENMWKTVLEYLEKNSTVIPKSNQLQNVENLPQTVTENQQNEQEKFKPLFNLLLKVSNEFTESVLQKLEQKISETYFSLTSKLDYSILFIFGALNNSPAKKQANSTSSSQENQNDFDYNLLDPKKEETLKRLQILIENEENQEENEEESEENAFKGTKNSKSRHLTSERCRRIKLKAAKLFGGVRTTTTKLIRPLFNSFFLDPIVSELDNAIRLHFNSIGKEKLTEMMGFQVASLKEKHSQAQEQVEKLREQKKKFSKLVDWIKEGKL